MECRAGQRIGDRNADIVRPGIAHQGDGLLDFGPGLARIAELEKEQARMPWRCRFSRASKICQTRVPLSMASRTSCAPDSTPIQTSAHPRARRSRHGVARHQIAARLHLEGNVRAQRLPRRRRIRASTAAKARKCRRQTRADRAESGSSASTHLRGHQVGRAAAVVSRPRSASRTSCSGTGIRGWKPHSAKNSRGRRFHARAIGLGIHQVPGRHGQRVQIGDRRRGCGVARAAGPTCQAANLLASHPSSSNWPLPHASSTSPAAHSQNRHADSPAPGRWHRDR